MDSESFQNLEYSCIYIYIYIYTTQQIITTIHFLFSLFGNPYGERKKLEESVDSERFYDVCILYGNVQREKEKKLEVALDSESFQNLAFHIHVYILFNAVLFHVVVHVKFSYFYDCTSKMNMSKSVIFASKKGQYISHLFSNRKTISQFR